MSLHAEVKARLEAGTCLGLIVIKVLVEIGHVSRFEFALFHAVLENNASS